MLTQKLAMDHGRPRLHIDLGKEPTVRAARRIDGWIRKNGFGVLNVAGPRVSKAPELYDLAFKVLVIVFHIKYGIK